MDSLKEQLKSSLYITPEDLQTIAGMPEDAPEETLHLTPPPAPQALQARKPAAAAKDEPAKRKQRSDAGVPKKPPARAMAGDLFDIDTTEGRTFLIGTVRYWMSINASPQVEAVVAHLFRELDRRTAKQG